MKVFVTTGKVDASKTIVGFGSLKEYDGIKPGAKDAFYKINEIDTFLKALEADKIPLNIACKNEAGEHVYMKADAYYQTGVSKDGKAYGFNKIAIELQPERRNEAGELEQEAQKLYATKGKDGYSFDKNSPDELIAKFNNLVSNGADFTLAATKNETLNRYPNLMQAISQIDKSAIFELDFEKGKGAFIKSITTPITKNAEAELGQGAKIIMNEASKDLEI